jgi:hypothetical protein
VLALGGGVVEAEGGAWAASSRSAEIRPVRIREPELAELVEHGGVGERLPGVAAGEQPGAGGAARLSGLPEQESGEGLRDGRGRLAEVQEERAAGLLVKIGDGEAEDTAERLGSMRQAAARTRSGSRSVSA